MCVCVRARAWGMHMGAWPRRGRVAKERACGHGEGMRHSHRSGLMARERQAERRLVFWPLWCDEQLRALAQHDEPHKVAHLVNCTHLQAHGPCTRATVSALALSRAPRWRSGAWSGVSAMQSPDSHRFRRMNMTPTTRTGDQVSTQSGAEESGEWAALI